MQNAPTMLAQKMMARQTPYGPIGMVSQDMSGNKKKSFISGSMAFNGSGQSLNIPNGGAAAFGLGDFTVEAWIYISSTSVDFGLFSTGPAAAGSYGIYWLSSSQKFESVRYGDPAGSGRTASTYPKETWLHIAASRVSGTAKLFINGISDSGASYAMGNVTALTNLAVGNGWSSILSNGFITGFRILLGTGLYTNNFTPPKRPLLPIENTTVLLNANTAETLTKDSSPNNYLITNVGGVTHSLFVPYI